MPITQPATPPTGEPTSAIPNEYDESGMQEVQDDVFAFDVEPAEQDTTPEITNIVDDPDQLPIEPENPENPNEPDPRLAEQPKAPVKPVEPVTPAPQTELKLYAGKFKTPQDLKNSFIELGGDPAQYGENVQQLEEAYQVRQREYSRVRAEIAHQEQQPSQPATPRQTFQEILSEEFSKYDPATFATPADMWKAQTQATAAAAARFEAQQPAPQQGISPQDMAKHVRTVEAIAALEAKAPIIKSNKMVRDNFAMHVRVLRDEGRMPTTADGHQDLEAAFKDFVQGYSGLLTEASKSVGLTNDAKELSSATNQDAAPSNPAAAPKADPGEDLVDEILGYKKEYDHKYQ